MNSSAIGGNFTITPYPHGEPPTLYTRHPESADESVVFSGDAAGIQPERLATRQFVA
jgi:hypothetical protein